jgi:hypothetical protein
MQTLKKGSLVLGADEYDMPVTAEVTSALSGEMSSAWMNLRTKRSDNALGSYFYSLFSTPDHEVMLDNGEFATVGTIRENQLLRGFTSTLNLDHIQKSVLIGILLGDGSLVKGKTPGSSWALRWSHSEHQEDYLKWTVNALGSLARVGHEDVSGYGSRMLTARTSQHPDIRKVFEGFDKPAGDIPERVEYLINPFSLAFWYMDDGSITHSEKQQDRVSFATYSFSDNSIEILRRGLGRVGIESSVQDSKKGKTIRLNYQAARMMFTMISSLVPPSMQYKLPEDLRGGPGWFPRPHMIPGYRNIPLRTVSNLEATSARNGSQVPTRGRMIDVSTSTGNLYVNGMLLRA